MMYKSFVLLFLIIGSHKAISQTVIPNYVKEFNKANKPKQGAYFSLHDAEMHPNDVKSLTITSFGLTGIPIQILKFVNLEEINLSNNEIYEIPEWIEKLKLKKILLNKNKIVVLPESIFKISTLKKLDLWGNDIKEISINTGNSRCNLVELNLSNNKINAIHGDFSGFPNLKIIRLENNELMTIDFSNFKSLEEIYLYNNHIHTFKNSIINAKNLKIIDLEKNPIKPAEVADLKLLLPNCIISLD